MEASKTVQPAISGERVRERTVRMLALVDLAKAADPGSAPSTDEATDGLDKLRALLHSLRNELEALHADATSGEVSHV